MERLKRLWLIWCRTVDHRIGKTDDDKPDIPILKNKEANVSLAIRSFIISVNIITCFFICTNIIVHWPEGDKKFPAHWGRPPAIETKDYRPLPGGYGYGSSTLYNWILENSIQDSRDRENER
tara:strand:- start:39 stop:404 length:366 start_codon:yes stop_codon:yes gene_type:complete